MPDAAAPKRDCELTPEIARAVLCEQFPELRPHTLRALGAGWDHEAYELNGEWVVRMPMRADVAVRMPVELGALTLAAEVMELPVPRIELRGQASARYPHAFTGYRKLPGVGADAVPLSLFCSAHNARALGRSLGALHRISAERAHAHGVTAGSVGEPQDRAERVLADRAAIDAAVGPDCARRYADFLAERPSVAADAGARVLRHDDLHAEHVLVDPGTGETTGIIDWTDANTGDPASDFVLLYACFGEPFVRDVLDAYHGPADPDLLARIRVRARWILLHWISRVLEREPGALPRYLAYFDQVFPR